MRAGTCAVTRFDTRSGPQRCHGIAHDGGALSLPVAGLVTDLMVTLRPA
jgi:hypothetical protein